MFIWSIGVIVAVAGPQEAARDPAGVAVLVLGTFHMGAEPGLLNPNVQDVFDARRQAELDELVGALMAFKPTKVALEAPARDGILQEFARYKAGDLTLRADERHQVGFRLARVAGHDQVFGVDHVLRIDPQEILNWAQQHGQHVVAGQIVARYMRNASSWSPGFMHDSSMIEIYRSFNSPTTDQALHDTFVSMLQIGSTAEPVGASSLATWYERNIRIAANILRLVEPGDRVVVLFGANHRKLLIEFLQRVPGVNVVDPGRYLGG